MRIEIRWGSTIHDTTIFKYETIYCDDEKEFWKVYDDERSRWKNITANVNNFTIEKRISVNIEEYRNRNNGDEEE